MKIRRVTQENLAPMRAQILALRRAGHSLPDIGRAIGRDHSTVYHHLRAMGYRPPLEWAQFLVHRGAGL